MPAHPSELRARPCIRQATPVQPGWAFQDGARKLHVPVDGPLDFNHAGAALLACEQGAGFGQFFSYQVQEAVQARQAASIVYPHARLLPARTRAFVDAARKELAPLFA